jgi:hypothetical protein
MDHKTILMEGSLPSESLQSIRGNNLWIQRSSAKADTVWLSDHTVHWECLAHVLNPYLKLVA